MSTDAVHSLHQEGRRAEKQSWGPETPEEGHRSPGVCGKKSVSEGLRGALGAGVGGSSEISVRGSKLLKLRQSSSWRLPQWIFFALIFILKNYNKIFILIRVFWCPRPAMPTSPGPDTNAGVRAEVLPGARNVWEGFVQCSSLPESRQTCRWEGRFMGTGAISQGISCPISAPQSLGLPGPTVRKV